MSPTAWPATLLLLAILGLKTVVAVDPVLASGSRYPPLPNAVASFGAVACDGFIYVYGGHVGGYHSKSSLGTFHRLPVGGGESWEELPGGPRLIGAAVVSTGGKVYRVGGTRTPNMPDENPDFISEADVAVYEPMTRKWTEFPALPAGRSAHDAVAVGGTLVVVGGVQWTSGMKFGISVAESLVCDTTAKEPKWLSIPQPFERLDPIVAAIGSRVFVVSPLTEADAGNAVGKVHVLDVETGKWEIGPAFPGTERIIHRPAACVLGGRLVLNTMDRSVFRFNNRGDGWDKIATTTESRHLHRLVPVGNDKFLAIAGRSKEMSLLASVEEVVVGN